MIEIPFWNDFYSTVRPENKNEIIEHCMNPSLELPKMEFEWGDACLSDKVSLKLTGFTELLQPYIIEVLSEVVSVNYRFTIDEVWKNTYHRYYHQESHSHPNSELSFVIFMNDYSENDAKFYFLNERNRVTSSTWLSLKTLSSQFKYLSSSSSVKFISTSSDKHLNSLLHSIQLFMT